MFPSSVLVLAFVVTVQGQLNPLGRFGKCIKEDIDTVEDFNFEGTWYLQYRPENPDHLVHTCQAQYEHVIDNYLHSLLYFYNKGKSVNEPQHIKYKKLGPGKYYRAITVDEDAVDIKLFVLDYDEALDSRVLYLCADSDKANPNIFNVEIATKEQVPENLETVLAAGQAKLKATSDKFDVPLMKVEQSLEHCAPLVVTPAAKEALFKNE